MDSKWSVAEIFAIVRERLLLVAGIALALLFAAVAVTFVLPRKYEAVALVRVVDNRVLHDLYGSSGLGEQSEEARVAEIRAGLLSRPSVEYVASLLGADVAEILATAKVALKDASGGEFVFRVSCRSVDPARAQKIVTFLAAGSPPEVVPEGPTGDLADLQKVQSNLASLEQELAEVRAELAAFEERHAGLGLGRENDFDSQLRIEAEHCRGERASISVLAERLRNLESQLADEPEWRQVPGGSGTDRIRNETWTELEKSRDETLAAIGEREVSLREHAAHQRELEESVAALPGVSAVWERLRGRVVELTTGVKRSQEQEAIALNSWHTRLDDSALVRDVIEPPAFPVNPDTPSQVMIAVLGLVLGVGAGIGTALIRDLFDSSFRTTDELAAVLGLPVLGAIAVIETPKERHRAKRRRRVAIAAILALFFLTGLALFVQVGFDGDVASLMASVMSRLT